MAWVVESLNSKAPSHLSSRTIGEREQKYWMLLVPECFDPLQAYKSSPGEHTRPDGEQQRKWSSLRTRMCLRIGLERRFASEAEILELACYEIMTAST